MCENCYTDLGRPADWNPTVAHALELIRVIYEHERTGGPLHVILDDWNIEDGDIRLEATTGTPYTPDEFLEEGDAEEVRAAVAELVPLLGKMTVPERASALARHDGYLPTATEA
jgi:hypothetical protein